MNPGSVLPAQAQCPGVEGRNDREGVTCLQAPLWDSGAQGPANVTLFRVLPWCVGGGGDICCQTQSTETGGRTGCANGQVFLSGGL